MMNGKGRGLSVEEQEVRLRVAAYLRRAWEQYVSTASSPTQADFAEKIGIHFSTVSHILKSDDGAGFNVFIALHQRRGIDATSMLRDPLASKYYEAVPGDGRVERYSREHKRQQKERETGLRPSPNHAEERTDGPSAPTAEAAVDAARHRAKSGHSRKEGKPRKSRD